MNRLALIGGDQGSQLALPPGAAPRAAPASAPAAPPLTPGGRRGAWSGRELDGWLVGDLLGEGAMGAVYRALQPGTGRVAALKLLAGGAAAPVDWRLRFAQEARLAALIDSPHVVRVLAAGGGDPLWLAMELAEGGTLAEELAARADQGRRFAPLEAVGLALQAAHGLAAAHRHRLVHRDIKPGNLLLGGDGRLRIADFGLARQLDAATLTAAGAVVGTPQYLSPEQGRGAEPDARSDLYSLGCVLYELLTLRRPFAADSAEALIFQHNFTEPALPAALHPDIPPEVQAVCLKCLQKDPARRFAGADELAADLERVRAGLAPVSAVFAPGRLGTGADEALRRRTGRRLWPLAATAALVLGLAGLWWWLDGRKAEEAQVRQRLAPLALTATPPATAEADLARLARLAGADDPQVRQGGERLEQHRQLAAALAVYDHDLGLLAERRASAVLADRLAAVGGEDQPPVQRARARLRQADEAEAALRASLAGLDRADPLTAGLRAAAAPQLDRLAALAGSGPDDVRWRDLLARGAAEEERLRRRCARLDEPAALGAAALAELEAAHARLAALAPGDQPPAAWAARLGDERRRLDGLRARLEAALAAPLDDGPAAAEAEAAAAALDGLGALDPGAADRLAARRGQRAERERAAAARLAALRQRCAALDAPRPLPPGIEDDLRAYEAAAGLADAQARAWRERYARIRLLQDRLAPLDRAGAPPAGAPADLDALAALVGPDDPALARWRERLAALAAAERALAADLDPAAPIPADAGARLDAFAALAGGEHPGLRRWRAKLAAWAAARARLDPLAGAWVLDQDALAACEGALAAAVAAAGADDPAVRRWGARLAALRGPPAPPWAAGRGHDRHGPWLELAVAGVRARLRWLPPGTGRIGSPADEPGRDADEAPVLVRLSRGLWLAEDECAQELWRTVMGGDPARFPGGGRPVEQVSALQADDFCLRLGALLPGSRARLPSEAEWELAMRAGSPLAHGAVAEAQLAAAIAHLRPGDQGPRALRQGPANPLGLHDGPGNLREWCRDGWGPLPTGAQVDDPLTPPGARRVARGGSWGDPLSACRIANRAGLDARLESCYVGFRFAIEDAP